MPLKPTTLNKLTPVHSATLLTPAGAEIEHPKSPWTPSYSVTTQGPGIPAEEDIPAIEDLPSSLSQVPVVSLTPVVSSAPLDEVQTQTSTEISEDRPKSPWTPSYSVSVQGSPLHGTVGLDETERVSGTVVADISIANEPASSQANIPGEVEPTTEPVKDESQEQESIAHPQSTLTTEEHPEATGEAISTSAPESVIEKTKTTDDGKIEQELTLAKELTTDTGIDHPASPQVTSYSATEGIVSTASEAESTFATSLVHESVVYEALSQVEEPHVPQASIHEVADKPDVTIISQPVVVAEDAGTSGSTLIGAVLEVRDLHAVERPVEPVASPSIELQSEETDGIASTPELDDDLEKPADVKVDVESHAVETVIPSEESQPVVQEPVLSSMPLAHEDAVVEETPEVEEPSVPSTTVPEVQSVTVDVGAVVVPQTYISAEDEVPIEPLPTVDELPKEVFAETVNAQLGSDSIIQEVIATPEPVSEAEVKQVSSSEELLATVAELERPASPWTPSYSVTQQGHVTPTSEVETNLPTSGATIDAPAPTEHIVQAGPAPEDLSTNVGPSIELPQALAVVPDVSGGKESTMEDPKDVHPSTAADVEILHESDTTLLNVNTEIDRPSSPWTPSYSVTQQGSASPIPGSDLDVEPTENEVVAKDELDEDTPSFIPGFQRQVESAEPVVAQTPVPVAEDTRINDESKLPVEGGSASSVLEHEHEVNATQEESLGQADASLTVPVVEKALVAAAVPEVHAVVASPPEPEVESIVKEEPAESFTDIRALPTAPELGNDLGPAVKDDTVSVGKQQQVTLSSSEPARDMGPAVDVVDGKQAEEGHKEEVALTAPELAYDAESSVKDETVASEPLTAVEEKESKGGEDAFSHAQVLVDEIKSVVKDEPGEDEADKEATSPIPASIEEDKQAETELVREEEVTLPLPESEHDSRPALEDVPVEDKTEVPAEKAAPSVPDPELQTVAPETEQDTESAIKDETFEEVVRDDSIVSPAPVSVAQDVFDQQVVPLVEEESAKGEAAGDEHQQAAESEERIETVEDAQVQDGPVVQNELIKKGQDNTIIPTPSEPVVEDKQSGEQATAPSPELEREIESAVADDHVESVAAHEPEPHLEPVVEAKVELVATPAPDPHHEIEAVEKEVEEPAAIALDEPVALPVPEPESAVAEDESVASPAPVESKSESAIVDDSALSQDSDIESKANDEQIEVPVTKEVPGPQEGATLPAPKAEPEPVVKAEEGEIKVAQEIEPAGEDEVVEEHDEEEASAVQQPLAKDEPTHVEQVAVPVLEAEQRTAVVDVKEAEDRPVSPEPVAEDGPDKDEYDAQDEVPSGRDKEFTPPAPELESPAQEESLEDEQAISPVSKEEPAVAEPVPEEVKEPVPEPAALKEEVIIPPAPEPATEIKPLEDVVLAAPKLDSAVEEKDEQAILPGARSAPVLKEEVDVEAIPELEQESKEEVDEPAEEQLVVPEPAVVEEEPVIPRVPEPATEIEVVEPRAEEGIEDEVQPAVPPVAEIKNEPVISTPELVTEAKSLEQAAEVDVGEQAVVLVPVVSLAPELVTEVKSLEPTAEPDVEEQAGVPVPVVSLAPELDSAVVDEPSVERHVEPKAEDVPVEVVKDEQVEDKSEEPIVHEREHEQAESREPQQEQAEKTEVELAKEEVKVVASEEKTSPDELVHVEEASDDKQEAEPAAKDEEVVADSIDSRELSVDTSSFTDSTKSPWTPSHSMTTQDVGSPDVEMKKDLPGRAFPVTEEDRKSVGSLDTVNESADVVPETLEVPFARKRLESSASARLLRGALHKVPEGRASLDMAQGEFTKLPSPVVDTSTVGIAEPHTAEQEAGSASSDESDGSSDDSSEAEHKGRWCVVM
ncbi:hypothetical protein IW261DRAFT_882250 [Armillaria novae-zelandiae]|uniref:Uncharacterized protein n=1 Tax=Armillaria novae-zelandiae TaxID=153914 RepID=A0AA39UDE9_9AGAR|nr:hypothetical protein IW261DRAFT_882250 [Armillaria novae-zelandiae]